MIDTFDSEERVRAVGHEDSRRRALAVECGRISTEGRINEEHF